MDLKTLEELIRLFEASSLSEIEVEEEGRRMRLQKGMPASAMPPVYALPPGTPESNSTIVVPDTPAAIPDPVEPALPTIDSPMVGTFYSAPSPDDPPFVRVGDRIDESATVCIVEAMKLMNEVAAKFACVIERVLVENGQPVEFGQPLFAVRTLD